MSPTIRTTCTRKMCACSRISASARIACLSPGRASFREGKGAVNPKGLDYYNRVVDELLANDIQPYITLFHWDLPAALPGGWQSRDTSKAFADYAGYVTKRLSDRVHHWMTTNEFTCFTDIGYREGRFAPGLKLPDAEANQVCHNGILAHGLGVQAIRANTPSGTQVGLAENTNVYIPVIETPENIKAAQLATRDGAERFLTVLMEGKYPATYLQRAGAAAPKVEPGDLEAIGSKLDFVALNVYTADYVRAAANRTRVCGGAAPGFLSAHGLAMDQHRSRVRLLDHPQCKRALASGGGLHQRERLFRRRCCYSRRAH